MAEQRWMDIQPRYGQSEIILFHLKAVWIYIAQTTLKISNKITKQL